jgi:2-methylcitrate dehydratase
MTARQSPAPAAATPRDYDPEIKDIASYVHNYRIDSNLAVSRLHLGSAVSIY